jgi:hypothetical protein
MFENFMFNDYSLKSLTSKILNSVNATENYFTLFKAITNRIQYISIIIISHNNHKGNKATDTGSEMFVRRTRNF